MTRLPIRGAAMLAVLAVAGCPAGASAPEPHAPPPESSATTARSAVPAPVASASPRIEAPLELPNVRAVLDDPRLARARERERAHNYSEAAWALEEARRAAHLDTADACRWNYVIGRMRLAAGESGEAAATFDRASEVGCTLAAYASLRAAQAYLRGGHADDAIARVKSVAAQEELGARDEARLVLAEALALKGDKAAAVPIWRAFLASNPNAPRWIDTAARLAGALLDGADGPPDARAQEAYDLATRVVIDAPKYADSSGAQLARSRAVTILRAAAQPVADPLPAADQARQAQAWLDAGEAKNALTIAEALFASLPKAAGDEVSCKVALVRAQATPVRPAATRADAFADAITRCESTPQHVTALYQGAKASASAGRMTEALARYAKVEQLFPKHRYADDARFHGALLVRDMGDAGRAMTMLSTLPDAYPDGDMRGEALFRVALDRLVAGDDDGAKAVLDRAVAMDPRDHHWASAGRAAYFRAVVAQRKGEPDAKQRFAKIVAEEPLAYYMALAHARLAAIDPAAAKAALDAAIAKDAGGTFFTREHPEMRSPPFERALRLLEVGEVDAARRELSVAGLIGDKADAEVVWSAAWAFNSAGAPEIGHSFARGRLAEFLAHYPEGHWRAPWEVAFPRAFEPLVKQASEASKIPAPLTWAIMREESAFHADAKSHSNALGLMQLLGTTAKEVARGTNLPSDEHALKRPEVSIPLGAKLLASLRGRFAHPALPIAAYNSGSGSVRKWLDARGTSDLDLFVEQIPYDETRNYVKRVLASEVAYAYLYARPELDGLLTMPVHLSR